MDKQPNFNSNFKGNMATFGSITKKLYNISAKYRIDVLVGYIEHTQL